jgi:hypothetical protein
MTTPSVETVRLEKSASLRSRCPRRVGLEALVKQRRAGTKVPVGQTDIAAGAKAF